MTNLNPLVLSKFRTWHDDFLACTLDTISHKPPNPGVPPGPSTQQREILSLFGRPGIKRHTVRSGHGTGKDAVAAWIALAFFNTRPNAKILVVAPTNPQLKDVFWTELTKWIKRSVFADDIVIQSEKIFHKSNPQQWWIRGRTPAVKASAEEQAETLAGFHGDHTLLIIDEASGVKDAVYTTLEGCLTQEDNHVILIGNMTKNTGYFYDTHFHPVISKHWQKYHWDSSKSTNVLKSTVDFYLQKYREKSNVYRIRIAGEPPLSNDDSLIPLDWSMQCVGTDVQVDENEPLYLGVDVARQGGDLSIILPRKGLKILPWDSFNSINTIDLGGFIQQTYFEQNADGIAIDEIGVGAGVTDWLIKHGHIKVMPVNVATVSSDQSKYDRLRDELWWKVREKCERGIYSFPDVTVNINGMSMNIGHELCNELAMPTYEFNQRGAIKVSSKKEMRTKYGKSPNIADALCLTEYFHDVARLLWKSQKTKKAKSKTRKFIRKHSWMVA